MANINPPKFQTLSLGSIKATGWLERQLRLQADSLSGNLDTFWPDIRDSQWFGGDSEAWERAPYWLDGIIPLAYTLGDEKLLAKVQRYMEYIITHQQDDGWLGPRTMIAADGAQAMPYDLWGQLLATKVMMQYAEASGDPRAVDALRKNLQCIEYYIDRAPLFNWGQFRWFEALIAILWLYEREGASWLLSLAAKLHAQGFDWSSHFKGTLDSGWPDASPTPKDRWNYMSHVVNNAMMPKAPALWWRVSGDPADRDVPAMMIANLEHYHGMVTGMFTGDECLAGKQPTHGSELCAVVEYAYSLGLLTSILGDAQFADKLEQIIFNALPATFSPDMWSHQYDQQVNQVECSVRDGRTWNTNGPASNTFGVEPNYGCCTANLSQGWPKFATHLWMRSETGLVAAAYAPSTVNLDIKGVAVKATMQTDYPFEDTIRFTIEATRPVRFPMTLRIPAWADGAYLVVNGVKQYANAGWHNLTLDWDTETTFDLVLPMKPELREGYNGAVAIARGPLVYALPIEEDWRRIEQGQPYNEPPHAAWEIHPTSPWNYALDVDTASLDQNVTFEQGSVGLMPFSPQGSPVKLRVHGRRLPEWGMDNGNAMDAPHSPVTSEEPLEALKLIPYGCTNLRITEFPKLKR